MPPTTASRHLQAAWLASVALRSWCSKILPSPTASWGCCVELPYQQSSQIITFSAESPPATDDPRLPRFTAISPHSGDYVVALARLAGKSHLQNRYWHAVVTGPRPIKPCFYLQGSRAQGCFYFIPSAPPLVEHGVVREGIPRINVKMAGMRLYRGKDFPFVPLAD